jgi:hypothetical protein
MIMLSNVAEIATILSNIAADRHLVTPGLFASTNPYSGGGSSASANTLATWAICQAHAIRSRKNSCRTAEPHGNRSLRSCIVATDSPLRSRGGMATCGGFVLRNNVHG